MLSASKEEALLTAKQQTFEHQGLLRERQQHAAISLEVLHRLHSLASSQNSFNKKRITLPQPLALLSPDCFTLYSTCHAHFGLATSAPDCIQSVRQDLEGAQTAVKELHAQKAALSAAATAAEERAASARRRLPRLDEDKRAAAAAKVC